MSRCYRVILDITNVPETKVDPVLESIEEEWEWDEDGYEQVTDGKADIHRQGVSYLGGGTSEEEFAKSLALSIWRANEGYCHIDVAAFSLDDPSYSHCFDEEEWRQSEEEHQAEHWLAEHEKRVREPGEVWRSFWMCHGDYEAWTEVRLNDGESWHYEVRRVTRGKDKDQWNAYEGSSHKKERQHLGLHTDRDAAQRACGEHWTARLREKGLAP